MRRAPPPRCTRPATVHAPGGEAVDPRFPGNRCAVAPDEADGI